MKILKLSLVIMDEVPFKAKSTSRVGLTDPGVFLQFLDHWSGIYH